MALPFDLPEREPTDPHTHIAMHPLVDEMIRDFPGYRSDTPLTSFKGYIVVINRRCPIGAMYCVTEDEIRRWFGDTPNS